MEGIRVYVVGSSMFANNVAHMLRASETVKQVVCFPTIADALHSIDTNPPHVLIFADVDTTMLVGDTPFLPICPDIPVICTDHESNILKLITTTQVSARLNDLVNAVTALRQITSNR